MTGKQRLLVYLIGLLAGYLFTWPFGLLMCYFFSERCGDFTITENPDSHDV